MISFLLTLSGSIDSCWYSCAVTSTLLPSSAMGESHPVLVAGQESAHIPSKPQDIISELQKWAQNVLHISSRGDHVGCRGPQPCSQGAAVPGFRGPFIVAPMLEG